MGLLNNNDYIDPFKGSDYIDPSSNAERLSNQVNRDHARRESYVQRRYVKPAQSDQASRDRQAPQNTRSKQDGRSQQAQGDQSTRGDTLQTMLNDWSTQTMRYAQSMQQSLQQALRQISKTRRTRKDAHRSPIIRRAYKRNEPHASSNPLPTRSNAAIKTASSPFWRSLSSSL